MFLVYLPHFEKIKVCLLDHLDVREYVYLPLSSLSNGLVTGSNGNGYTSNNRNVVGRIIIKAVTAITKERLCVKTLPPHPFL
jgi:hypothetical protein